MVNIVNSSLFTSMIHFQTINDSIPTFE